MERFCWKGHVNSGKLEEYARKHNEMYQTHPEMEELMRAAGMRNYCFRWLAFANRRIKNSQLAKSSFGLQFHGIQNYIMIASAS